MSRGAVRWRLQWSGTVIPARPWFRVTKPVYNNDPRPTFETVRIRTLGNHSASHNISIYCCVLALRNSVNSACCKL